MRLQVFSDYGQSEKLVSESATPDIVEETMSTLDWQGFHQVILSRNDGSWLEVGGSLDPSDGLSVMYEEGGTQHVIKVPPTSVGEMTTMLLSYLSGSDAWKQEAEWD